MTPRVCGSWLCGWILSLGFVATGWAADAPKLDFQRVIRPILSEHCFRCHGPDNEERKAGLRLDEAESATDKLESGSRAIVPGKIDESELVARIFATDPNEVMPPPSLNKPLTEAQKQALKQWVAEGAEFRTHWSFSTVRRPAVPEAAVKGWARNEVDHFILAKLQSQGLKPSAEADKNTLIRRVTLDLTGLPPTQAEVDAFLKDTAPGAYERLVERLFQSPHHAERMTLEWLDVARYADTNGYHIDNGRDMTRWREWVIEAFAKNKPYDEFVVEQLAGDLLPKATLEQKIASGFNRNHMINFEGGAIPEEYHNAYIVDRVNTFGTVFLGLSVACAQCHDHKYDPISQKDYYRLYSFFYNVPEKGLDGYKGNSSPMLPAPSAEQQQTLDKLRRELTAALVILTAPNPEIDAAQAQWEVSTQTKKPLTWTTANPVEITVTDKK